MYKLLIVDDEPFILDGLLDLFQENKELDVYIASSGNKALDLLDQTRMDIVLTDIQMPGISGLDLQREIQKRWPYCKLVILTAYHEFSYIHQAINQSAAGYVLKSEGEQAIVVAVDRCIAQIQQDREAQAFIKENEQYIESALPMLQSACLLNLLEGEPAAEYQADFVKYQIHLDECKPSILVAIRLDRKSLRSTMHRQFDLFLQIKAVFQNYFSEMFAGYETIIEGKTMIWLLQPRDEARSLLYLRETLEIVQAHCLQALDASISIIYGDYVDWLELPTSFGSIKLILNQITVNNDELILANSRFYLEKKGTEWERSEQETVPPKQLPLLQRYLEDEDYDNFANTLHQLLNDDSGPRDALLANLELYHTLTHMLLSFIKNRKLSVELFADQHHFELFYRFCDKDTMENGITNLVKQIFALRQEKQETHSLQFAAKLHHYIMGHLADDLSLSSLAGKFYLNPVYLSRLYKQTTGNNLTDYITRKRIEYSEQLLLKSEFKIHHIAKEAGFESAAYFSRVFKKQWGITPIEYRARHVPPT